MKRIKSISVAVVLFAGIMYSGKCFAQHDPMFTNYMWNEMFINPAYAGSTEAISVVGLSRQQWVGIDGAPNSQSLSIHGPFYENSVGVGVSVLHEGIGVTNETSMMGTFAYHIQTSAKGRLGFGLSGGAVTFREKLSEIVTQTPGDIQFQENTPLLTVPNAAFGMYYHTKKFYAGLSVPRLIDNQISAGTWVIHNKFSSKTLHYNFISGYVFDLNGGIKIKPTIMCRYAYATPFEVSTSLNFFVKDCIWAGLAYRTGDAVSVLLGIMFTPSLRLSYSYDYTTNKLKSFNSGTHEISIGYDYLLGKKKTASPRLF